MFKKMVLALVCVGLVFGFGYAKDFEAKKFKVIVKITYNTLTLEEAAQKEKEMKKRFSDACAVDLEIKEVDSLTLSGGSSITFF